MSSPTWRVYARWRRIDSAENPAAYEAIEVSSRRFEIYVYDPEGTELEVSGVEYEALPDLVGKFDAVEEYPAGAWQPTGEKPGRIVESVVRLCE